MFQHYALASYAPTPNLPTNIVDFRGFDSSIILIVRGGILMSIGDFPECLSQAMLVGTMLVGRLGVLVHFRRNLVMYAARDLRAGEGVVYYCYNYYYNYNYNYNNNNNYNYYYLYNHYY